ALSRSLRRGGTTKRFVLLEVVACLCGCALSGAGRADTITYDAYVGGNSGTLAAELVVAAYMIKGAFLENFSPTVLARGLSSPGDVLGSVVSSSTGKFPSIIYLPNNNSGQIDVSSSTDQFPTNPAT